MLDGHGRRAATRVPVAGWSQYARAMRNPSIGALVVALFGVLHLAACRGTPSGGASGEPNAANDASLALGTTVPGSPFVRRVAAEWEPAVGVLVAWPPCVPHALVVDLARDATLHLLVADDAAIADALLWLDRWQVDVERVEWIVAAQGDDVSWVRDWGPHPVFGEDGRLALADPRYELATPITGYGCDEPLSTAFDGSWGESLRDYDVTADDAAPARIAATLGFEHLPLSYALTGGNLATDGHGLALSSCILVNENEEYGFDRAAFLALAREQLGLSRYTILSNFEARGIQHVDCMVKLLDERRMFVVRPPADHPAHEVYERILREELSALRTVTGEPFEILRLDTARFSGDELAAYSNALILNANVYVPLFGIEQDEVALAQWRAALPGHTVRGYTFVLADEPHLAPSTSMYDSIGWTGGDALHCRTRAVWDREMLAVDVVASEALSDGRVHVRATIADHSGRGVVSAATNLVFRAAGASEWSRVPLVRAADGAFVAHVPAGATAYFVESASASGRSATSPRKAPAQYFVTRTVSDTDPSR
jgi:agmatine/peptidylarginine deiminase